MPTVISARPGVKTTRKSTTSSKPVERRLRWLCKLPGCKGAIRLALSYARRTDLFRYFIARIPSDFGIAFEMEKIEADGTMGETYHVCIENQQDAHCDCKGHERWGTCKHVDAARAIIATEKLS